MKLDVLGMMDDYERWKLIVQLLQKRLIFLKEQEDRDQ